MYIKENNDYVPLNANIQKSIKFDQKSYLIVTNSPGKNFSDKLRSIISFYAAHKNNNVLNKEKEKENG